MAQRTTTSAVQSLLGADYGKLPDGSFPGLQQYVDSAVPVVDRMAAAAVKKKFTHTAAELEIIERWLSAHYYTRMDPTYTNRSTQGASGGFVSPKASPERYRETAIELDASGCLNAILNRLSASTSALGTDCPPCPHTY